MSSRIDDIMDYLRNETRVEHRRVEMLPFAGALAASQLALESYVAFLDALRIIHANLESAFSTTQHPVLRGIWTDDLRLLPHIESDLAFFAPRKLVKSSVVMIRAQIVAQRIRQRSFDEPLSLLGYLYVLTGATLGGTILKDQVADTFGLVDSNGLSFLSIHTEGKKSPWAGFRRRMNAVSLGVTEQRCLVEAANEAFAFIAQILEALHPFEVTDPNILLRTLNWEAGKHMVPLDEREIEAALRAGERSLYEFPYYRRRYGARGERYTRSDSAWLVTLAGRSRAVVEEQVGWLGRVLAVRGMPQWMLERHLMVLQDELVQAVPENAAMYGALASAADTLGRARRAYVSDELMAACALTFEERVGSEWSRAIPEAGALLAAAVADEKLGIKRALASVESWMVDERRFPPHWIEAVHMTIRRARNG